MTKTLRFALLLSLAGWLAGCVPYPVYKMLQPAAQITVLDESNRPLQGAKVILIANAYPYALEKGREIKMTDGNGLAAFASRHEWRTESLFMHGAEFFFWNWCVQKPGFKTYLTHARSSDRFDQNATIRLAPGASSECPDKLY